jgi:hypothetical protein
LAVDHHALRACGQPSGPEALDPKRLWSLPRQLKPVQQIIQLQLRQLPPIEDRLHDLRRQQREPQNPTDIGRIHALARDHRQSEPLVFCLYQKDSLWLRGVRVRGHGN